MRKSTQSIKKSKFTTKWVAIEDEKIIAEGLDISEVYVNAMMRAKVKPTLRRVPI